MNTEYWLSEARLLEPYDLVDFASSVLRILFSTPREEKCGFTVPFYSVQDCTLWNRRFFFAFFRRARKGTEKREAGVEDELRASRAPRLTRACLRSPEKRQKKTTTTTTTTCKIRRNRRKLEKTTKSVAWRWVV